VAAITVVIRSQQPDAVALLEATDRAKAAPLARDLGMHLMFGDANNEIHVAWLSHIPVRRWAKHCLPSILAALHPLGDQPHLLVGDLVGTPPGGEAKWGDAVDGALRRAIGCLVKTGDVDRYRARHPGVPGYTYPSAAPWLRLDYAFASPTLAACLVGCDLIAEEAATQASDHRPI
jgi:hypothetical protein